MLREASSAKALGPSLRRAASISVASGLYGSFGFAPTRLNTADDPSREKEIRPSSELSISDCLPAESLQKVHSFQFSRPVAGWIRLFVLVSSFQCAEGLGSFPLDFHTGPFATFQLVSWWTLLLVVLPVVVWLLPGPLIFDTPKIISGIHVAIAPSLLVRTFAMPLTADSGAEVKRATRRVGIELFADRIVPSRLEPTEIH